MRAFVAVAEEGGVSAAARRLHVSQSALSQTVRSLERQLGIQLLERDHTGARPTAAGLTMLGEVRALLERHDAMIATMTGRPAEPCSLRIGVPLEFPLDLLPSILAELNTVYPELKIGLRHSSGSAQLTAIRSGDLDLALVRDRPYDPLLDSVLVVEEAMGVILTSARSAELADATGVRLDRLRGMSWMGFARSDSPAWHDQVTAILRTHGVPVRDLSGDQDRPVTPEVKLAAAGTGRSFAFASRGWLPALPPGLIWHPLIGNPIVRRTWAVWPAASTSRHLAALVATLDLTERTPIVME